LITTANVQRTQAVANSLSFCSY